MSQWLKTPKLKKIDQDNEEIKIQVDSPDPSPQLSGGLQAGTVLSTPALPRAAGNSGLKGGWYSRKGAWLEHSNRAFIWPYEKPQVRGVFLRMQASSPLKSVELKSGQKWINVKPSLDM